MEIVKKNNSHVVMFSGKSSGRDSGFLSSGDLSPNYVLPDAKGTSGPVYQHSISCESSNSSSPTSLRVSSAPAASRTSIEAAFKRAANGKQRPSMSTINLLMRWEKFCKD